MILEHVEPFAWLVVVGPPTAGALRAYSLDRFEAGLATTVWRTGVAAMVAAFLLLASPWGMALLAWTLAEGLPGLWESGLASVYRATFAVVYLGFPVAVAIGVRRRFDPGERSRRSAALALGVSLFVFLALVYPEASHSHCPLFRDGVLVDGFCATEG